MVEDWAIGDRQRARKGGDLGLTRLAPVAPDARRSLRVLPLCASNRCSMIWSGVDVFLESNGVVVLRIAGAVEQRNPAASHRTQDGRQGSGAALELCEIAPAELVPSDRVMAEPAAQCIAWR